MNETGTLYFFTGLAGAGKTTIGRLFYKHLKEKKDNVVIFDGDEIRRVMGDGLGYSMQDRLRSSLNRHFPLCRLLTEQGIDVVTCNISMFSQVRDWNRKHIQNYKRFISKSQKKHCMPGTRKACIVPVQRMLSGQTCHLMSRRHQILLSKITETERLRR